ncbi:MAG: flagellar biosynthetic protein FliO [Planctomycetaceae bacterium]|nr:flagellar biosynthetic protein FliO [Planctomycetaceae bacterium]
MQTPFSQQVRFPALRRRRPWAVLHLAGVLQPLRTDHRRGNAAAILGVWVCFCFVGGACVRIVEGQTYDPNRATTSSASTQLDSLLGINPQVAAGSRPATTGQFVAIPSGPTSAGIDRRPSTEPGSLGHSSTSAWQPQTIAERSTLQDSPQNTTAFLASVPVSQRESSTPVSGELHATNQPLVVNPVDFRADNGSLDPLDQRLPGPTPRGNNPESIGQGAAPSFGQGANQLLQTGIALAVVLALMLGFFWVFRRTAPKSLLPLPLETVQVLGNAPLHGKQHLRLIRLGHRVLLLAVSENTSQTLAEITDPDEVRYMLELCEARVSRGESQTFAEILQQSSRERTTGFLGSQQDQVRHSQASKPLRETASRSKSESATHSAVRPVSNHFFEA